MSKPAQLSRRLSIQAGSDTLELLQKPPFDGPEDPASITLTPDTAEKLLPYLERFVKKHKASLAKRSSNHIARDK